MNPKWVTWLAWGAGAIASAGNLVMLATDLANRDPEQNVLQLAEQLAWYPVLVVFSLLAALILSRQPRNLTGWLLMIPGFLGVLSAPAANYLDSISTSAPPASVPILFAVWYSTWEWVLLIFPLLLIPLLFPTGSPPSPRWRWVFWASIGLGLFIIFLVTFSPKLSPLENGNWEIRNPIGFLPESAFDAIQLPWFLALGFITLACVAAPFVRYSRAGAVEREQIKWLLYACGLFAAVYIPGFIISDMEGIVFEVWALLLLLSILAFPVSIAIAITRYRLWDIDVIIRRTLIYGALTVALALMYAGSVVVLQEVFRALTGSTGQSQPAIIVSTLAVAALFSPLRRRVQERIDRRFFRNRYDAERILADFAAQARQQTDLDTLTGQLLEVVQTSLQPESVSIWLKGKGHGKRE